MIAVRTICSVLFATPVGWALMVAGVVIYRSYGG